MTAFRALRYAGSDGADISALTAPPYDVIGPEKRAELLTRDPHNVVALELPEGPLDRTVPGNRYEVAAERWRQWRAEGVLVPDARDSIYVLQQSFESQGQQRTRCSFVAAVGLEPFSAGVILPHELTLPKAIEDRLNMTRATAANLSPILALFADTERRADALAAKVTGTPPLACTTDDSGGRACLWAITEPADQAALADLLAEQSVIIADGHHRYTTALAYRDERREMDGAIRLEAPYESVMMALVSVEDPGLAISPTHRIADAPSGAFDPDTFWTALREHFDLRDLPAGHPVRALSSIPGPAFIVRTRDGATKIAVLRDDVSHDQAFPEHASQAWRGLGTAVLQELVLRPLLDIHPDAPQTLDRLTYTKDAHAALDAAQTHDAVFIMSATPIAQVSQLAFSGEMMPQKSTYFAPKLPSGLLFRSLD